MAITANTQILRRGDDTIPVDVNYPVTAGAHLFAGAIVGIGFGTGTLQSPSPGTIVVGRLESEVDNTGGGLRGKVKQGIFCYANSAISPVSVGQRGMPCYAEDNGTISATDQALSLAPAGFVYDVTSEGVWVYMSMFASVAIFGLLEAMRQPTFIARGASTADVPNLAAFTVANDGITLTEGERVFLKDQAVASENGLYVVGTVAVGVAPLTRSEDMDENSEIHSGITVIVTDGTANADTAWSLVTADPISIGVTNLAFAQVPYGYGTGVVNVTKAANAAGTSPLAARVDHKHDVTTAAAGAITGTPGEGAANSLARSDHDHGYGAASVPAAAAAAATVDGLSAMLTIRAVLAAGGGGADDVVIYNANSPFNMRILDTILVVSTAGAGGSVATLRDAAGGGGAALSDALSSAATGYVRNAALVATPQLAANSTLTVRRSDSSAVGEIIILAQRY